MLPSEPRHSNPLGTPLSSVPTCFDIQGNRIMGVKDNSQTGELKIEFETSFGQQDDEVVERM